VLPVTDIEVRLLADAIYLRYGHDFRDYAPASLKRRVLHAQRQMGVETVSRLQDLILRQPQEFARLLEHLTIPVSEMFRDPAYFHAVRTQVVPVLQTYPSVKIWIAGCGAGEEAYSMAILLREEGLLERTLVYATDINPAALDKARKGIYAADRLRGFTANYQKAGGTASFADYYSAHYGNAMLDKSLRDNITFADHSLATDAVFSEVQFVSCRNVLIYFNRGLQDRALGLFHESLAHRGFLGLGSKETLEFSAYSRRFDTLCKAERIYRKLA
jgi:chemotaxis protein methyltransferase CheR